MTVSRQRRRNWTASRALQRKHQGCCRYQGCEHRLHSRRTNGSSMLPWPENLDLGIIDSERQLFYQGTPAADASRDSPMDAGKPVAVMLEKPRQVHWCDDVIVVEFERVDASLFPKKQHRGTHCDHCGEWAPSRSCSEGARTIKRVATCPFRWLCTLCQHVSEDLAPFTNKADSKDNAFELLPQYCPGGIILSPQGDQIATRQTGEPSIVPSKPRVMVVDFLEDMDSNAEMCDLVKNLETQIDSW